MEPPVEQIEGINEKYYYKIGEAAKKIGVQPYVIRYWETEFSFLKPYKSKSSHRLYSKSDIEKLSLVKNYLYDKKFTIEGAKRAIRLKSSSLSADPTVSNSLNNSKQQAEPDSSNTSDNYRSLLLKDVKDELNYIKSILSSRKTGK